MTIPAFLEGRETKGHRQDSGCWDEGSVESEKAVQGWIEFTMNKYKLRMT